MLCLANIDGLMICMVVMIIIHACTHSGVMLVGSLFANELENEVQMFSHSRSIFSFTPTAAHPSMNKVGKFGGVGLQNPVF